MFRILVAVLAFVVVAQATAHAQTPDPERLAVARELVSITGGAEMSRQMLTTMRPSMLTSLTQQGVSADVAERFLQLFEQEFEAQMPRIQELGALAYTDRFTLDQLRELLAFYQSETGRAVVREGPAVVEAMTRAGVLIGQEAAQSVIQRMQAEGLSGPERP